MKHLLFLLLLSPSVAFGQKIDLSEKEAFQKFKHSNIRKELHIKLKDFNYKTLKSKAAKYNVDLSKMVVLNSTKDKDFLSEISKDYQRRNPKSEDGADACIYCNDIPFYNIEKRNFYEMSPD